LGIDDSSGRRELAEDARGDGLDVLTIGVADQRNGEEAEPHTEVGSDGAEALAAREDRRGKDDDEDHRHQDLTELRLREAELRRSIDAYQKPDSGSDQQGDANEQHGSDNGGDWAEIKPPIRRLTEL